MRERTYRIEKNDFDSGLIATKVGDLILSDCNNLKEEDGIEFANYAHKNNYSLVYLKTTVPVKLKGFTHVGVIKKLTSTADVILDKVSKVQSKFLTRFIEDKDWVSIEELLYNAPPTRYSNDKNLTKEQVVKHKLAIFKHLTKLNPNLALAALSRSNELIGIHFLKLGENNDLVMQEIHVKPAYQIGFVSLQLVKENLNTACNSTKIKSVVTRVYEDNAKSIIFFKHLGFIEEGNKEFYYHLWLN